MAISRIKKYGLTLQILTLIFFTGVASAQSQKEVKEIFAQAESYFLYEDYELANQLYLLLDSPDNLNIKYKIGTCYLNIPDEKDKAIPYLEDAVKNASYDAKVSSVKETRAPLDAYFSLAKAYMINNDLEKSLSTFQKFYALAKEAGGKGGMQNIDFVSQQIQACNNAIKFQESQVQVSKRAMGAEFSMGSINENPAVSFDGNTIVYTEQRGLINVILFSKKIRDKWQTPIEITSDLNAGDDCSSCSLNKDGTELYLYKNDNFDGNIYSSKYENDRWTPITKLNKNINTKFYESHASVSSDGKKLYFTSNREGGQGGLDIYVSEKDATGDWGPAVNLGNLINTQYNEDTPFITENDSLLYFCSEGHTSMGGYDNFKSQRKGNSWDSPENLGSPVNTTDDDKFFQPANDGHNAYYSIKTDYKKKEIFYLGIGSVNVNLAFEITGKYSVRDTIIPFTEDYKINLIDRESGDTVDVGYPNKYTGRYSFMVGTGSFRLVYGGPGLLTATVDTAVNKDNPVSVINIDVTLQIDTTAIKEVQPVVYEKINLSDIPVVAAIDSSHLVMNMNVLDVNDAAINEEDILYYTVQVMALRNPVDISYFKYIQDMKVLYNEVDKFFRYTTGQFKTREEANVRRLELIRMGYPDQIFIKKVSK